MTPVPYQLHGIELATALVYGSDPGTPVLAARAPRPPRDVLEGILLAALASPPCVVGFSGGRDSSAVLALSAHLARREGLTLPIAATNVFPGDEQAAESEWQELLIRHVGVEHWERLVFRDEMDVVGPHATPLLLRYGPTFPFNGHFGMPSFRLATGGTYLTGVGGDELFEPNETTRLAIVLRGGLRPVRGDLPRALHILGPRPVRTRHWRRLIPDEPWLRTDVATAWKADLAEVLAHQKLWFSDQVCVDVWRDKARIALYETLSAFGATVNTRVVQPFQDPGFLSAVASHVGRTPWRGRAAAMRELFGDVLPAEVVSRTTKASFDSIFFHDHSRAFVRDWDGSGVDPTLVDVARLRSAWQKPAVDARSLSLLQGAWTAAHHGESAPSDCEHRAIPEEAVVGGCAVGYLRLELKPPREVIHLAYEAPMVEVVGSLHDLTQTTKYVEPNSDGYYLGVKGASGVLPLGS